MLLHHVNKRISHSNAYDCGRIQNCSTVYDSGRLRSNGNFVWLSLKPSLFFVRPTPAILPVCVCGTIQLVPVAIELPVIAFVLNRKLANRFK